MIVREGGLVDQQGRLCPCAPVEARLLHREGHAAHGKDEGAVTDRDRPILNHGRGLRNRILALQFRLNRDAENGARVGIDGQRAVVTRCDPEKLRIGLRSVHNRRWALAAAHVPVMKLALHILCHAAVAHLKVRNRLGHRVGVNRCQPCRSLLPMTPVNFPLGGVGQNDGKLRPKVAPRRHSQLLLHRSGSAIPAGRDCDRSLFRGLVDNVLSVAIGQITCACSHQVQSRPDRPFAIMRCCAAASGIPVAGNSVAGGSRKAD